MFAIAGGILIAVMILAAFVFGCVLLGENPTAGITVLAMVAALVLFVVF